MLDFPSGRTNRQTEERLQIAAGTAADDTAVGQTNRHELT
jgi:hypothetical protein